MKTQKGVQGSALEEQLNALDSSVLRGAFVATVCGRLTHPDSGLHLEDFLSACQFAAERDLPLTDLCTSINALQITKDMVTPTQLSKASTDIVRRLVAVVMQAVSRERTESVLRMLGSLMFWPQAHLVGMDEELVTVCREYIGNMDSLKMCQLALECIGNMLRRSNTALNSAKDIIYPFFQSLTDSKSTKQHIKIYAAAIRVLHYILPQDHPSDSQASALFFSLRTLLYLGTPFAPEHLRGITDSDSSSSETSDSDLLLGRNKHTEKIKCYGLICVKALFQTNAMELFKNWPYLFPNQQRGNTIERLVKTPSLVYMLFVEKSVKVKVAAAAAIAGVLEHSPLSAWKGKQDAPRSGPTFTPFSSELGQIIVNLHEAVAELLRKEENQQVVGTVLKLGEVLLANTPYQSMKPGLVYFVCEAGIKWLQSSDLVLKQAVLSLFSQGFSIRPSELEPLLVSEALISTIFPMSLSEDLIPERLSLLSRIGTSLPQCLFTHMSWVKSTLPLFTASPEGKISAMGFNVIAEHMKTNKDSPLSEWVLGQWLEQLNSDSVEVLGQCFTALAAFPSLAMMNEGQNEVLRRVISQFSTRVVQQVPMKVALLKLISKLIPESSGPFFQTLYTIIFLYKADTSLAVALAVAEALTALVCHSEAAAYLEPLSECLIEKSKNKNEKIVSGAVIAIGKLIHFQGITALEGYIERLMQAVIKALEHKNAKVGWDACEAMASFLKSPACRIPPIHSSILPVLLTAIEHHHNYKTRIFCAKLLDNLQAEVNKSLIDIVSKLLDVMELDLSQEPENFAQSKQKHSFRLAIAQEITLFLQFLSREHAGLAGFLSAYSHAIFEAIKAVEMELAHMQAFESSPVLTSCQLAAKTVHFLIESDPEVHVSFGIVEALDQLSRFGRGNIQWLLGYSEAPEDIDIAVRSERTPTSPSHKSTKFSCK